ncbi:mitochondrial inner membrane protease ATP23-like [Vicia villosa]|uniref:mitochondrial inner membrane protease ATP23-like n=1 Tax=Vicia villosa TaxID=3911 RepID=UPI00273C97E6|nr:mitochondrial inner membrane protease ATP23-like [Vicia villosa]
MTENDKALKDCERMIHKSLKSPIVKFLREHLDKSGCPVQDNFFKAIHCDKLQASGYIPGEGIAVCGNRTQMQDEVTQAITHELIHAFDDCRGANLDWTDCAHHACSEIRAAHLSGDCHFKRELLRGFLTVRAHEQECVKRRVLTSLSSNSFCSGSTAKDSMEAVWDVCYNDTAPFDRAP